MTIAASLLLLAGAAPAIQPPPRIEAVSQSEADGLYCTADRQWCIAADEDEVRVTNSGLKAGEASYPIATILQDDGWPTKLWPHAIRFGDILIIGIEAEMRSDYSGGGGRATQLHLLLFRPGRKAAEVLSVPVQATIEIRACFSEEDMAKRAGACHDEYGFKGRLWLDGGIVAGVPTLHYRTVATSWPGPVSRNEDSLTKPPLRKRDLVTVTNPRCSFERTFRFAPVTDSYQPDTPLPDCSDYTDP